MQSSILTGGGVVSPSAGEQRLAILEQILDYYMFPQRYERQYTTPHNILTIDEVHTALSPNGARKAAQILTKLSELPNAPQIFC
ncbi:hypothetical protein ACFL96_18920, partial [Thermoproteota archaeon]